MTISYNGFGFSEIHALGFNIAEVYHGSDLVWGAWKNILYDTSGDYQTYLPRGYYYQIKVHGAGGAGGTSGGTGSGSGTYAGAGGAGAPGKLNSLLHKQEDRNPIDIHVGAAGLTKANGGNGGNGGSGGGSYTGGAGGAGGGGGEPSYILINEVITFADGGAGGGGGGGGGTNHGQKSSRGAGGGGGGGLYKLKYVASTQVRTNTRDIYLYDEWVNDQNQFVLHEITQQEYEALRSASEFYRCRYIPADTELSSYYDVTQLEVQGFDPVISTVWVDTISGTNVTFKAREDWSGSQIYNTSTLEIQDVILSTGVPAHYEMKSVAGKNGANQTSDTGAAGTAGNTTDYPNLRSGAGGTGYSNGGAGWININGGAAASGGGASGASGGGFASYSSGGSEGGGGGAGAAGDNIAGGGGASYRGGGAASNHYTNPLTTVNNVGETVSSGWGIGGTTNTNGTDGWVYIERIGRMINPTVINLGTIFVPGIPTSISDAGDIDSAVTESDDAGALTSAVSETDDAGELLDIDPSPTVWDLGLITDTADTVENCGPIM